MGLTLSLVGHNLWMIYCKAPFDPEAVASTGNNYQEKEVSNIIYDVMSKLSAQDRKIFMMKKFDGKSYKEISEELGITTSVIDHSLRNTTAKMKVALADYTAVLLMILSLNSSL